MSNVVFCGLQQGRDSRLLEAADQRNSRFLGQWYSAKVYVLLHMNVLRCYRGPVAFEIVSVPTDVGASVL